LSITARLRIPPNQFAGGGDLKRWYFPECDGNFVRGRPISADVEDLGSDRRE
jgi:hypothetical protein